MDKQKVRQKLDRVLFLQMVFAKKARFTDGHLLLAAIKSAISRKKRAVPVTVHIWSALVQIMDEGARTLRFAG